MAYAKYSGNLIDYHPYRLHGARPLLRGPDCDLNQPYVTCLGGAETYGRFLEDPYPDMLGRLLNLPVLNLGQINAGLDVYLNNPVLLKAANNGCATVIEVMGAHTQSNRFYTVHPHRNDRFVKPSPDLVDLYPEVDFSAINFTRHLLTVLHDTSRRRFATVQESLQRDWTAKMRILLEAVSPEVLLLWFSERTPKNTIRRMSGADPLFVTRPMLQELCHDRVRLVKFVPDREVIGRGLHGMTFSEFEQPVARTMLGYEAHVGVAERIAAMLNAANLQPKR